MSDVINFPTRLVEWERELLEKEINLDRSLHDVSIQIIKLKNQRDKIKKERILHSTKLIVSFCLGLICGFVIVLPLL